MTQPLNHRTHIAAAWQIASDLVRRHHHGPHRLTALETHSAGGGTYHILCLVSPHTREQRVLMNLDTGRMTPPPYFSGRPSDWGNPHLGEWARDLEEARHYARALLTAPHRLDVVCAYEAMESLPNNPPKRPMSRYALTIRVMAEVAARAVFGGPVLTWASVARDSTYGSSLHPAASTLPALRALLPNWEDVSPGEGLWSWWLLLVDDDSEGRAALVLSPEAWLHTPAGEAIDLFEMFRRHGRTDEAVRAVLRRGPGVR